MTSGHAEGSVSGGGHEARWNLDWPTGGPTYQLLPPALYRGPVVPTKPFSPNVDTPISGTITIDGDTVRIEGAHGQQGHLYGTRHAERWAWAHCADFLEEDAAVHALTAQGRRGPFTTPFLTVIGIRWEGRWIRLRKASRRRDFGVIGRWNVDVGNRRYRLTGRFEAPVRSMLRARYEDPDGTPRFCHNSEIASSRLALFERKAGGFEEVALLESNGTTHAEWAGRTPAAAVESEFFEVGE
jgi:tocopherol cyclase-like protein